jgi:hypothetical protein
MTFKDFFKIPKCVEKFHTFDLSYTQDKLQCNRNRSETHTMFIFKTFTIKVIGFLTANKQENSYHVKRK